MRRWMTALIGGGAALALLAGTAMATPPSASGIVGETARGPLVDRPLDGKWKFAPGTSVKLKTKGRIEVANQRIVAEPGATFGWHSHPGPTVVTVLRGTLTLYHAEDCTKAIRYGPETSFSNLPGEIHLARNEGTEKLVAYAVYFVPKQTPPVPLRIDQPSPGPECPQ